MNEQLQKEILNILTGSKQFILEQAPEVIKETLRYETISNSIDAFVCISILVFSITLVITGYNKYQKSNKYDDFGYFMGSLIASIFILVSAAGSLCSIHNLVKIKVSPKYFLIEKFRHKSN